MERQKVRFNIYEREILNLLYTVGRWINTSRIARKTDMAWKTAKDTLTDLERRGYVVHRWRGNRIQWILRERY